MKSSTNKNPYANDDGTPKTGHMHQFFAWERQEELKRREKLSPDEIKKLKESDNNLSRKMNS